MTTTQTIEALEEMFQAKYSQARANGATDEQAIVAIRSLWLEHLAA